VAELLNLRKVLIDGACPELVEGPHPALRKFNNQAPKYKGVKIENFGSAKRILFLGKLKYDMQ